MQELDKPENIDQQIDRKKVEIKTLLNKSRSENMRELKKLRIKSSNNGKANILKRVSNNFAKKIEEINRKREENGFNRLSNPKITELVITHKVSWKKIEEDIIHFNTDLEDEDDGGFKNEQ